MSKELREKFEQGCAHAIGNWSEYEQRYMDGQTHLRWCDYRYVTMQFQAEIDRLSQDLKMAGETITWLNHNVVTSKRYASKLNTLAEACSDHILGGEQGWHDMEFDKFVDLCRTACAVNGKQTVPPKWYTRQEIVTALRGMNYRVEIQEELADWILMHLQYAFNKGYQKRQQHDGVDTYPQSSV